MDSANAASAASQTNRSSLAQRALSAVLLLPLVIALVWWSVWGVIAAVAVLTVIGLLELYGVFAHAQFRSHTGAGLASALAMVLAVALRQIAGVDLLPLALTLAIVTTLLVGLPRHGDTNALPAWGLTLAGALYIGLLSSHFILLRSLDTPLRQGPLAPLGLTPGAAWVYLVLAITWLQDTLAYFVGRGWGRHKLAPILSPKKTWEGAAGGLIGSLVAGLVCVYLLGLPISPGAGLLLGAVGGVVGPLGDLAESWIKRQAGLKDAGRLIPGHGGILDRADSLLFTGPLLYYLIVLLASSS